MQTSPTFDPRTSDHLHKTYRLRRRPLAIAAGFLADENGLILSAELVLLLTLGVLAVLVGLNEFAVAVNTELNDLSNAFGRLSQDYSFTGFQGDSEGGKRKSSYAGTTFHDQVDNCDLNGSCDIVIGATPWSGTVGGEWSFTGFGW